MTDVPRTAPAAIRLDRWTVTSGSNVNSRAAVVIRAAGHDWKASAEGNGAVDALFKAVDMALAPIVRRPPAAPRLRRPRPRRGSGRGGPGDGPDRATGRRARVAGPTAGTRARSTSPNTVAASIEAYIQALNAMLADESWAGAAEDARRAARAAGNRRPGARPRPSTTARPTTSTPPSGSTARGRGRAGPRHPDRRGRVQPVRGRRLGGARRLVRVPVADHGTRHRGVARGRRGRRGHAAAGRRLRSGRPRGRRRRAGSGPGRHRRRAVDGPSRGDGPPGDPVPGRLVRGDPRRRGGVRRGRRQLRVQPRRAAGRRARRGAPGPAAGRPARALDVGCRAPQPDPRPAAGRDRGGRRAAAAGPAAGPDELPHRRRAAGAVRGRRVRGGRRVAPPLRGADPRRRHAVARRPRLRGADPAARDRPGARRPGAASAPSSTGCARRTAGPTGRWRSRSRSR